MPAVLKTLRRLIGLLEERGVPYMLIGGYALPFYGRIRTTLDVELAIMAGTEEELERLREELPSKNFEVRLYSPRNPLFILADREEGIEVKVWLRPDGVVFDEEALRRRRRVKLGEGLEAWIVSPEDFIVNKLARPDRGVVDEQDVKSVLARQGDRLDQDYLRRRAERAGVLRVLEAIQAA